MSFANATGITCKCFFVFIFENARSMFFLADWEMILIQILLQKREQYCAMLRRYPHLFITNYHEISGFRGRRGSRGRPLRIELRMQGQCSRE